ncbi:MULTISPECIES: 16S rRNA (guanine(527)-N(7))-methyltransferase RsmG [Marinobacter]|jgi:16S rRNA (guanine527-N7)-methyltransferase|uniref:Ribosomal RNA small subunit methyltransferase G n=1 Tax=Marinobacter excellens LAMA 842 TaxID=1306954 RepID=A0A137S4U0_9GAMM|nr:MULTISPECIES: 16S rRNA (guanine(527)-N(7))-methyltransferase RsmG [Marinobacter]KXO07450.1 rRNA small subunit 7-methylguanosine (m7G methyltransferase GidB) [Marinobacter excellens LAMA 842]MAO15055.1 16S rRNA (guanine(527)-N(7))-methyltransferase RsmG [Marinobacter sp.]MCD1629323.1 16S rRNA (guanine(527)-N(7))-methyltransferase RsmG [Marinobacter shengliensis]|tara:strand:+ start:1079 stop:1714 length:636 start_codon:yes stop_codon:yes gene_type:complete
MTYPQWPGQLSDGLAAMNLSLSESQQQQLLAFLALLNKWNKAYNLTAVRDERVMVSRQLLDSLSILPWVTTDHLLDVGAGGGLPGIPLAIVFPEKRFTLLDSNGKKTRFLNQCVLELGLGNVEVIHGRAEDCQPDQPFTQISSRAFTALENLVTWCGQLLASEGEFLAMKGQYPDDEVAALPAGWQVESSHSLKVPGADGERHLLIVTRAE